MPLQDANPTPSFGGFGLKREIAALEAQRNNAQATIDWRFSIVDARVKLKRVYPSVSTG